MTISYILIDYENVQPTDIYALDIEHIHILLFVGPAQTKIPVEFAASLQRLGNCVQYIQVTQKGNNALDFHIAFHIGVLSQQNSQSHFYIISNDTGFDPLLAHLKARHIRASRHASIKSLPCVQSRLLETTHAVAQHIQASIPQQNASKRQAAQPKTVAPQPITVTKPQLPKQTAKPKAAATTPSEVQQIKDDLRKRGSSRPTKVATLTATIKAIVKRNISPKELETIIQTLQQQALITISDTKVSYHFPNS